MVTTSPLVLVLPCMRFVRARLCLLFLFDKSRFLSKHVNPVPRNSANRRVQLARSTDARVHEPTLKIFPGFFTLVTTDHRQESSKYLSIIDRRQFHSLPARLAPDIYVYFLFLTLSTSILRLCRCRQVARPVWLPF